MQFIIFLLINVVLSDICTGINQCGNGECNIESGICICNTCYNNIENYCVLDNTCNCTQWNPTCSGQGTCGQDGWCVCDEWSRSPETFCEKCNFGMYGPDCADWIPSSCSSYELTYMCSNHGTCTNTINPLLDGLLKCRCDPGFVQPTENMLDLRGYFFPHCSSCIPDHYGPDCRQVNCTKYCGTHGACVNYTTCQCHPGWNPATSCTTCLPTHTGSDCQHYKCSTTNCNGHGWCNSNSQCVCSAGYYGNDCQYTTINVPDESPCNGGSGCGTHGVCTPAFPNSFCACYGNFQGSKCDICKKYYTGPECIDLICEETCQNGQCSYPDVCTCDFGYFGERCEICDNNWIMCNRSNIAVVETSTNVWPIIGNTVAIIILIICLAVIITCIVILVVMCVAKIEKYRIRMLGNKKIKKANYKLQIDDVELKPSGNNFL